MIRRFVLALGLCAFGFGPVFAQDALQNLPPEVREQIEKVHLQSEDGRLAAVETVPAVFQKLPTGDFLHKPSGYVCPRNAGSLGEFLPGLVTIFDSASVGSDIGCGMLARPGISITVFVFKRSGTLAEVLAEERAPALESNPPTDGPASLAGTAEAFGPPAGIPFAAHAWNSTKGTAEAIYITKLGDWFVHARVTANAPDMAPTGLAQAQRIISAASQQIAH